MGILEEKASFQQITSNSGTGFRWKLLSLSQMGSVNSWGLVWIKFFHVNQRGFFDSFLYSD
jgi:hypothetical protein